MLALLFVICLTVASKGPTVGFGSGGVLVGILVEVVKSSITMMEVVTGMEQSCCCACLYVGTEGNCFSIIIIISNKN
jgi:hypothetical protein